LRLCGQFIQRGTPSRIEPPLKLNNFTAGDPQIASSVPAPQVPVRDPLQDKLQGHTQPVSGLLTGEFGVGL
jgi:hypothetical protein